MKSASYFSKLARHKPMSARRRGISTLLFALCLPMIFGCLAIVIDLGNLYNIRARAQRAADAGALAGAITATGSNNGAVVQTAKDYCGYNEFPEGDPTVTLTVQPSYLTSNTTTPSVTKVRVVVVKEAKVYFSPVMESLLKTLGFTNQAVHFSRRVASEATAEKVGDIALSIPGFYGIADPNKVPANLAVFGPYAEYQHGDPFSVLYRQNGTPNPEYDPKGFEYTLKVGSNFKSSDNKLYVQIFDPDSYSGGGNSWDEVRSPNPANPTGTGNIYTTTEYTLVAPDGRTVETARYTAEQDANEKWVTPKGFDVDLNTFPATGDYKLRVKSIDGSSENGFALRAGPKEGLELSDIEWNKQYGDVDNTNTGNILVPIQAEGSLQMNFTKSGTVNFSLGNVSKDFAGKEVTVSKFDVDIGSQSIQYNVSSMPGEPYTGTFPPTRNGTWSSDTYKLPESYQGGTWSATYVAGAGDTSNWKISGGGSKGGRVYLSK
jgi:Flp pilus assembly protein TadG